MWWGFNGIPPAQMNSMVPRTHMGRLLCPKPTLFNYFERISTFPGKLHVAPASLAYFPLWGPAAVAEGLTIILHMFLEHGSQNQTISQKLPQATLEAPPSSPLGLFLKKLPPVFTNITRQPSGPYFVSIGIPRGQ